MKVLRSAVGGVSDEHSRRVRVTVLSSFELEGRVSLSAISEVIVIVGVVYCTRCCGNRFGNTCLHFLLLRFEE